MPPRLTLGRPECNGHVPSELAKPALQAELAPTCDVHVFAVVLHTAQMTDLARDLAQVTWRSRQKGVVRYNCADSLDRTNAASYFAAVQV